MVFPFAPAASCGSADTIFVNATGSTELRNPFSPPQGPLSLQNFDLKVTLATTTSSQYQSGNATVEQKLWLNSPLTVDLTSPTSGVIGCGAIFHGLKHKTLSRNQDVNGSCDSIFSDKCITALMSGAHNNSIRAGSGTRSQPNYSHPQDYTATELCGYLTELADGDGPGVPSECSKYFDEGNAWIQTFVFASAQAGDMCSKDPASGSATSPLAAWGITSYSAEDMTPYENLTTSVTPILLTMAANRTIIDTLPEGLYSQEHLLCLRPSSVEEGSVLATEVPNSGNRRPGSGWWSAFIIVLASAIVGSRLI